MRRIEISSKGARSIEEIHDRIGGALGFPKYYGKNLDALYDCLTDISEPTEVTVILESDELALREYSRRIAHVFYDAEEVDPYLVCRIVLG